jgi:hypothetical protein
MFKGKKGVRSVLLVAVVVSSFALAQPGFSHEGAAPSQVQRHQGFNHEVGEGESAFRIWHGLELGTTLTLTFYDGDPASGGEVLDTLTFTYGVDSEVAFERELEAAKATAAFLNVDTSEQTRTVDLADFDDTQRQNLRPRELSMLSGLNDGTVLTATFYDGDPSAGGKSLSNSTFTYGTSSEAGFANDFATAAERAAFVTITTSAQTKVIDLTAVNRHDDQHSQSIGEYTFGHGGGGSFQHGSQGNREGPHGFDDRHGREGFGDRE